MIITAKFASVCPCCSVRITVGSKVEWSRGAKAVHVACAGKPAVASTSRRSYREPLGAGHGRSDCGVPGYSSYCTDNSSCRCYDCAG
jgi:hypothetical protein